MTAEDRRQIEALVAAAIKEVRSALMKKINALEQRVSALEDQVKILKLKAPVELNKDDESYLNSLDE